MSGAESEISILPSPKNEPPLLRVLIFLFLTLLPWPAVWYGMYELRSILWSFIFYHFVCLLPVVLWGVPLWRQGMKLPTRPQWLVLLGSAAVSVVVGLIALNSFGSLLIDRVDVIKALTSRGYMATWVLPLGAYFVVVNAALEELFWRGVILNELDYLNSRIRLAGEAWTAVTFCTWHWLVLRLLLKPGWAEVAVLGVLLVGVLCSWIYRKTGSILLSILWHALVFDLGLIVILYALQTPPLPPP